jgi:hypothetical protein
MITSNSLYGIGPWSNTCSNLGGSHPQGSLTYVKAPGGYRSMIATCGICGATQRQMVKAHEMRSRSTRSSLAGSFPRH